MAGGNGKRDEASNGQRALFTFLGYTLLAPLFAGVVVLAASILARPLGLDERLPVSMLNPGQAAIGTFIWAAIPAAVAGAALAAVVWRGEAFPWIAAAAAGGIAFMLAAIVLPLPPGLPLTPMTALACFIAIAVRASLVSGGVIER